MKKIKEQIEENIEEISKRIEVAEKFCEDEPAGNLRVSTRSDGMVRYYQTYKDITTGKITDKYLSKRNDTTLITQLAQNAKKLFSRCSCLQRNNFKDGRQKIVNGMKDFRKI